LRWDTVIEQKTLELSRFLTGKSRDIDFTPPSAVLERSDNVAIRKRILSLSQEEASRLGVGKSTLHYLRRNARADGPFTVYGKVKRRLQVPVER
jgi:CRISPR-associated protein Cas1